MLGCSDPALLALQEGQKAPSTSFGGGHPVEAGSSFALMVSSKGCKSALISGGVLERKYHFSAKPCVKAAKQHVVDSGQLR